MPNKTTSVGAKMQRAIDLGLIDNWLRGLSQIVPRPLSRQAQDYLDDFNTHLIGYDCVDGITITDLQNLTGCRQLLAACSKNNISIEIKTNKDGYLSVSFKPELEFKYSKVFGASYHNVSPALFSKAAHRPVHLT